MIYHRLFKLLFFVAFLTAESVSAANAAELRTYEFVSGQQPVFHLRGGLAGVDLSAKLTGNFDIKIENDGSAALTRFDVQLVDVVNGPSGGPNWSDGQSLAELLFNSPIGLTGMSDPTGTYLSSFPPGTTPSQALTYVGPATSIILSAPNGPLTTVQISSTLAGTLDAPDYSTDLPGLLVRLVPEPTSCSIALLASSSALIKRRRRRSLA